MQTSIMKPSEKKVIDGLELRDKFAKELENKGVSVDKLYESATWKPASTDEIDQKALVVGVLATENEDVRSLRELTFTALRHGSLWHARLASGIFRRRHFLLLLSGLWLMCKTTI